MSIYDEVTAAIERFDKEAPVVLSIQVVAQPKNPQSPLLQGYPETLEETVAEVPMTLSAYRRLAHNFDPATSRELLVEVAAAALSQLVKEGER